MQYWISPSSIHSSLEEKLEAAGLKPLSHAHFDVNPQEILLIYSAPDQVLTKRRLDEGTAISSDDVLMLYEQILTLSRKYRRSSSSWRLNLLDTTSICRLCNSEDPQLEKSTEFPIISPLAGLLTLEIIKKKPKIIDIYLDLELSSCLFGLEADSRYLQRLNAGSLTDLVLMDWWETNIDREASYEEVTNNLTQLTQIQNDYDRLVVEIDNLSKSLIKQRSTSALRSKENKDYKSKIDLLIKENKEYKSKNNLLIKENKGLIESLNAMIPGSTLEENIQASKQKRDDKPVKKSKVEGDESTNSIEKANTDRSTSFPFVLAKKLINITNRNLQ